MFEERPFTPIDRSLHDLMTPEQIAVDIQWQLTVKPRITLAMLYPAAAPHLEAIFDLRVTVEGRRDAARWLIEHGFDRRSRAPWREIRAVLQGAVYQLDREGHDFGDEDRSGSRFVSEWP
jgi:hypothetical protein